MPVCPFCFSKDMRRFGLYKYKSPYQQKWLCESCRSVTAFPLRRVPTKRTKK